MTSKQPQSKQSLEAVFTANLQRRTRWVKDYFADVPKEMQQFHFLLGEWDTTMIAYDLEGEVMNRAGGHWQAQLLDGGRLILDRYESKLPDGRVLSGGTTLRTFSLETNQWEMVFLNSLQANLVHQFVARSEQGEIHGQAKGKDLDGIDVWAKVRFYNIENDSFDWLQEMSWDYGETWYQTMTINAERVDTTPQVE